MQALLHCIAIADSEAEAGVHFKVVETVGLSLRSVLNRSNPLETVGCELLTAFPAIMVGEMGAIVKGVE